METNQQEQKFELTKSEQDLKNFELLKSSIDEQVKTLTELKNNIVDENTLAIANQQLSKSKQLADTVEERRVLVGNEALQFTKTVNATAKKLVEPLTIADYGVKQAILAYNEKVRKAKADALKKLQDEEAELKKKNDEAATALNLKASEFFKTAIKEINDAAGFSELSAAYVKYYMECPAEYGEDIKKKIYSLGVLKKGLMDGNNTQAEYTELYNKLAGITAPAPVISTPVMVPSFTPVAQKIATIQATATPSNIKRKWTFETTDPTALDRKFLSPDEKLIKAVQKDLEKNGTFKDGVEFTELAGLRFYQEESVKVK